VEPNHCAVDVKSLVGDFRTATYNNWFAMFRFQFAVAITLAISAIFSAALFFWLCPPNDGKIELPASYDSDDEFEPVLAGESDPFAVTRPEDFIDGTPIDEDKFWIKVCEIHILV
jgi:hypothetical protein